LSEEKNPIKKPFFIKKEEITKNEQKTTKIAFFAKIFQTEQSSKYRRP